MENGFQKPYILTTEEVHGVKTIRKRMGQKIPPDLNTDLNLRRWVHGWKGRVDEIEPRFKAYIEARKAAGLDGTLEELIQILTDRLNEKNVFDYISVTEMRHRAVVNPKDNSLLLYQHVGKLDMNHVMDNVSTVLDFILLNFLGCELFMRRILEQENKSGHPSGLTIVFDFEGMEMSKYVNPNCVWNRVNKINLHVYQELFCEMLHKMIAVKPPKVFQVIWELMKHFMNENTQKKLAIVMKIEDLKDHVNENALPPRLGGKFKIEDTINDPDTCMRPAKELTDADNFVSKVWKTLGIEAPKEWTVEQVKPKSTLTVVKEVKESGGRKIGYQFKNSAEVEFAVFHQDLEGKDKKIGVYPRLPTVKSKIPDEGVINCDRPGKYIFEFKNTGSVLLSLTIKHKIVLQ